MSKKNDEKTTECGGSVSIDLSSDRLLAIAADCVENHDYLGALKMLNKNSVSNGNDADSYMLYAEAFDDMMLYEKCINGWFKYLDYAGADADFEEAYEGIAVSFMNVGNDTSAAYYYSKLLEHTAVPVPPEAREEIVEDFLKKGKTKLKFAYPPRIADYSTEFAKGVYLMKTDNVKSALKEFGKIGKKNALYLEARSYVALCHVLENDYDAAYKECDEVLAYKPDSVITMSTYATIMTERGDTEGLRKIAERLKGVEISAPEDMFRAATVFGEAGMDEETYSIINKLEDVCPYDFTRLFFKAIAAFNTHRDKECLEIFDEILTIFPNAVSADYWRCEAKEMITNKRRKRKKLEYLSSLPAKEREENLSLLSAYLQLKDKDVEGFMEQVDVYPCIHWCFDECEGNRIPDLMTFGLYAAIRAGYDDLVRDVLLDMNVPDIVKIDGLAAMCEAKKEGDFGLVICGELKNITFIPLETERTKRSVFMEAYGLAFSHLAMLNEEYGRKIYDGTLELYKRLKEEDRLSSVNDGNALAAAIYKVSGIDEKDLNDELLCSFFDTTKKKIAKILGERK